MIRSGEVIFAVTTGDIINQAKQLGVPEQDITDELLGYVKENIESGLGSWSDVVSQAIWDAISMTGLELPCP